ncbi:MAG: hypothetical protein E6R04_10685 [Spirochaetes bacterium]|nr:MAG: hypothetical protein E6R04_10685 [Spirochaetota bacterium]
MAKLEGTFNPFDLVDFEIPKAKRKEALAEVATYLKEEVLSYVGSAKSPVDGENFEPLSKAWKKIKKEKSSSTKANLEYTGDMLDHFDVKVKSGEVALGVYGPKFAVDKARGHNQHAGDEHEFLPIRRFIPEDGEGLTPKIQKKVAEILENYRED